jgi:hypothetical protein
MNISPQEEERNGKVMFKHRETLTNVPSAPDLRVVFWACKTKPKQKQKFLCTPGEEEGEKNPKKTSHKKSQRTRGCGQVPGVQNHRAGCEYTGDRTLRISRRVTSWQKRGGSQRRDCNLDTSLTHAVRQCQSSRDPK